MNPLLRITLALLFFFSLTVPRASAYSVLSHEEVVDMAWKDQIVPLLKARFPNLTDDQLREAHAYAYGGSIIQDIGYYPFGDHLFSDLLHYVRTGDFVTALFRNAQTPDDFAFAYGALAHFYGDSVGHPFINEATAKEYPALGRRFGHAVTYDQDPIAHIRVEFSFDVVEVAHGRYSQDNYRDFIGFQVDRPLLDKAFEQTYGLPVTAVMKHEDLAISTYRFSVARIIPEMTKVALASYHDQIQKEDPNFDSKKFTYRLSRTEYEKEYGHQYKRPGVGAHILALLFHLVPKIGPFRALKVIIPNAADQDIYIHSMNASEDAFRANLRTASPPDLDLDTGKPALSGEYPLADFSYARLLEKLSDNQKTPIPDDVRAAILAFFPTDNQPAAFAKKKRERKEWAKVEQDLAALRAAPAATKQSAPSAGNE